MTMSVSPRVDVLALGEQIRCAKRVSDTLWDERVRLARELDDVIAAYGESLDRVSLLSKALLAAVVAEPETDAAVDPLVSDPGTP